MNELFKLVEPLLAILMGSRRSLAENSLRLSADILHQLREILRLIAQIIGSVILFCLGMSYFIDRLLEQLDRGEFHFTPSLVFLTVFMLLCLASIFYATKKSVWAAIFEKNAEEHPPASPLLGDGPIETAISLYILDVVKEREANRANPHPEA